MCGMDDEVIYDNAIFFIDKSFKVYLICKLKPM